MYVIGITGWRKKRSLIIRALLLALLLLTLLYAGWFGLHAVDAEVIYVQPERAESSSQQMAYAATAELYWQELMLQLSR